MTQEEIQQLVEELESLRKENLDLKISVGLPSPEIINGYPAPAEIQEDAILKGLRNQIETLQQANQSLKQALEGYENVARSLTAFVPALEVQMKGQTTEIYHLKLNIDQTENTFAGVVRKLEQQIKHLRKQMEEEKNNFRQEVLRLRQESKSHHVMEQSQSKPQELPSNDENPFTDLSIFEI